MQFIERAEKAEPIAKITEGTRINIEHTDESEGKMFKVAKREVIKKKGMAIVDFNFKYVDRFRTFYKISCETEKKLVISFKYAYFLECYY